MTEWNIIIPIHSANKESAEKYREEIRQRLNDKRTYFPEIYLEEQPDKATELLLKIEKLLKEAKEIREEE